ncbi:hypothetical protein FOZ63_030732 [Perkinsus olseni]|uniref:Uncharacterized protein n=1 Tax=Perkinsus olseni TaxID=32597 RepID=A0A7J6R4H8_PEROL|nr:hypothetical protein FOZ63_030732 [Perkinsus olseni]
MVQEGDDIERLAEQFVQDNGLPLELAIPLTEKIHEDLRLLGRPPSAAREESEEDKIEFDLRGVEHRSSPVLRVPSPNEDSPPLGSAPRRRPLTAVPAEPDKSGDEGGGSWRASGHRLWSGVRSRGRGGLRSGLGGPRRPPAKAGDIFDPAVRVELLLAASKKKPEQRAERSSSVFTKLHEHAEIKQQRLVKLKEQLEDERKSQSPRRRPKVTRQPDSPGHRLYRMHERKIRNLVNLQRDHVAEREEAELRGVTFKPAIDTSQRVCPGVSRLNRSMASSNEATRQKWKDERAARLRSEIEEQRMKECSFMPHINPQSLLIAQRRNPFRKNRSPFETLYQDAFQRKVRREEWKSYLPEEATFAPDIGSAHERPSNDDTREMFFRRLSSSKRASSPRADSLASHGPHPHGALRDGHCVLRQPTASTVSDSGSPRFPSPRWVTSSGVTPAGDDSLSGSTPRERLLFDSPRQSARRSEARNGSRTTTRSSDIFDRLFSESAELKKRAAESESAAIKAAKELSSETKALGRSREILERKKMEKYERLYRALGGEQRPKQLRPTVVY